MRRTLACDGVGAAIVTVLLLAGFIARESIGQQPLPTTKPLTTDASSPKAALKSLRAAIQQGDGRAVRALMSVENDTPGEELLGAYADLVVASARLGTTVKQKFPGTSDALAAGVVSPEELAKIDGATASIDGDSATVTLEGQESHPRKLRRVAGAWKLVVSEPGDNNPKRRAGQVTMVQGMADAIRESTEQIAADRFATAADAKEALKQRLGAVVAKAMQSDPPSSRPSTRGTE